MPKSFLKGVVRLCTRISVIVVVMAIYQNFIMRDFENRSTIRPMRPKDFLNLTDPEAIATNRRGQLSPSQRTLRTRFLRQQLVGGLFFLLFLGGLTIFGLVKEGGSGQTINSTGVLVFLALMGGAILLVISLSSVGAVSFYWSMTGEIAQAEGRVLWKGYYAAEIPGRTLTTPYSLPLDLPPGP